MGGTEHSSKTMQLSKKPSGYMEYKQKNFHNCYKQTSLH